MKRPLLLLYLFALTIAAFAQNTDEFGYTWLDSDDSLVTFDWIDITERGLKIEGLADDNSVGMQSIQMDFRFYWGDFDAVRIGSNGWLSFANVSNIASCFDPIPTNGGDGDLLVCPLLSDLNFANGSDGEVYVFKENTPGQEAFIISYINVPHWTANDAIFGSNTFQVIFSEVDSSITFQYLDVNDDFAYTCTGSGKIGVGIENVTGEIGLNPISGVMPPDNYAIKFFYPEEALIDVTDIGPLRNNNDENEGEFYLPEMNAALSVEVINAGNTDLTDSSDLIMDLKNEFGMSVFMDEFRFGPIETGNSEFLYSFTNMDFPVGSYTYETETIQDDDVNITNDINETEVVVLDVSEDEVPMSFAFQNFNTGTITWPGGIDFNSGGGVVMTPPGYPIQFYSISAYIAAGLDSIALRIYDDNGINDGPGDILAEIKLGPNDYAIGNWNEFLVPGEVNLDDGKFYLAWLMGGATVSLGTENVGPFSNSGFEIIEGGWAKYREGATADLMLSTKVISDFLISTENEERQAFRIAPNPANEIIYLENDEGSIIKTIRIFNESGILQNSMSVFIPANTQMDIDVSNLSEGVYFFEVIREDGSRKVKKQIIID